MKAFETASDNPDRYVRAVRWNKRVQRRAYKVFNRKLRDTLHEMKASDQKFWDLVKDIGGLDAVRSSTAPNVDDLADHFADKMTSGMSRFDENFRPNNTDCFPLSGFRIRFKRVLKCLKNLDPTKSANGVGPRFLNECAVTVAPLLYRLFKFIVRRAKYPDDWKFGRVTLIHKRGSVADRTNYRPVTVLNNCESVFEDVVKPQFESWICKSIPD